MARPVSGDPTRSARLGALYTGAVADILDELGHRDRCLPADIRPIDPGLKLAGPVFTVRGRARHAEDGADPRYRQMDMLEGVFPDCVVVVEPGDERRAAHWGELMSTVARARGAAGAVIAGGLRDTRQILDLGFPVFCAYHSPLTAAYRWEVTDFGVPIRIGGVPIAPGDYVLGDVDGVLVIPADAVDEVIARSESVRDREAVVRRALESGGDIRRLFEEYKVF